MGLTTVVDAAFWQGKRVLVTGHTGFKGSWLCLWLQSMGADVYGFALDPPTTPSLYAEAEVGDGMSSVIGDVRDLAAVRACFELGRPEIVIHLAAQPLVRASYDDPVQTYATNVMGAVHVLQAARTSAGVRAIVNVTTDKSYANREWPWPYREDDALGGHDPYSSSKACAELVTSAYRSSFLADLGIAMASARAGNVIGGGDWALDRLVPDALRAFESGLDAAIRNPRSIRPWQHVLEPLSGYLLLAERLWQDGAGVAEAWNFGPSPHDARPVQWIVEYLAKQWGDAASWTSEDGHHPHEAGVLKLDIAKAQHRLGWTPRWSLERALNAVVYWHRGWLAGHSARELSLAQIADYTTGEAR